MGAGQIISRILFRLVGGAIIPLGPRLPSGSSPSFLLRTMRHSLKQFSLFGLGLALGKGLAVSLPFFYLYYGIRPT